jgi:hypothetical protein
MADRLVDSLPIKLRHLADVHHIRVQYAKCSTNADLRLDNSTELAYVQQAVDLMTEEIIKRACDLAYTEARDQLGAKG